MNLRTKFVLILSVSMLLVFGLLTLNVVTEAATRAKEEERQQAEFLAALVSDWIRGIEEQSSQPNWLSLQKTLTESALFDGWLVVSKRGDPYSLVVETAQPESTLSPDDERRLRAVLDDRRVTVRGTHVYAALAGPTSLYAARLDLRSSPAGGLPFIGGLRGLVIIMALGTALLILNAYIFLNRFVLRPLDSLVEASRRVSEGDFSKKVPERASYDEVSSLVAAFNLMLDKIGKHRATLVDDVRKARERVTHTEKRLFAAQRLSTTGTLAAGIAHEINNPLGGMINAARTIQTGSLGDEKRQEYVELIIDGLERVRTIVQKVLQFRPKALEPQPVVLKEAIDRAIAFMDHRARHKGTEIQNELPDGLPPVEADPLELQQAFLNILMNAVDACVLNEGNVRVGHTLEGGRISIHITDNGCGMNQEELAHCMDLFYTTKEVGDGTGLGLSVAQNIIQNHGGKIDLESAPGHGTTVSIRLPIPTDRPLGQVHI